MPVPLPRVRRAVLVTLLAAAVAGTGTAAAQAQAPAAAPQTPAPRPAPGTLPPRPDPRSVARPGQTRIKVTGFKIEGADQLGAGRVKAVLGTRTSSWLPWGRKRYFDRAVFDADLRRIEVYYQDRGYPDAKVTAFDADLNDTQDAIALSVTVNEGMPRVVERLVLEGFDPIPPDELRKLRRQFPLQPGAVVDRAQVVATQTMATRALQDRGYPLALVSTEETPVPAKQVTLTLRASAGADALYGPVTVTGNVSVGDDVITRTLAFKPGNRFSLATIQLSQQRLYDLGLFQLATVSPRTEEVTDGLVPVQVTVAEAKHRQIRLGAGYGSEERLRGQAEWKHVNFFGGARTARVEGKYSALERGLRGSFTQPYLFSPKVSVTISGQAWYTDEPAFQLDTNGGRTTTTYELGQRNPVTGRGGRSSISVSVIGERDDYIIQPWALADLTVRSDLIALGLDPRRGEAHGFLGAIAVDYQRSTADNVLDATSGYTLLGHVERAGAWLPGDFAYKEFSGEARYYRRISRVGVLATRGRLATLDPDGAFIDPIEGFVEVGVPFFKRYFLGGSNSLRGWGRLEVAPLSASGLPIAGFGLLEMSAEFRVPVVGKISAVFFADAGSVASAPRDVEFRDLHYDAGVGLRYLTPIGPVRVDIAKQLTPIDNLLVDGLPETKHWRIHFSLGQAF